MPITVINWKGDAYNSTENCVVKVSETGNEIKSAVSGNYGGKNYQVDYLIQTNPQWETVAFSVKSKVAGKTWGLQCLGNGKGKWMSGGKQHSKFDGCIDIDISLTPFTNTLPIKRLSMQAGEQTRITVLYIDVFEQKACRVEQLYTKTEALLYRYENTSNDFKAMVTVDENGLVLDYPGLFTRTHH